MFNVLRPFLMKYNIVFILKLRKCAFTYYQENRLYKLEMKQPKNNVICDADSMFDTESKLVFAYLRKYARPGHVYILKNICQFNFNILVAAYDHEHEVVDILSRNERHFDEYVNKNIMSCILFTCKYKDKYFIFASFVKDKCVKFDQNNDTQLELVKYYYTDSIDYNKLFFSNDTVKYIKLGNKFKLTKYYPFYVNM